MRKGSGLNLSYEMDGRSHRRRINLRRERDLGRGIILDPGTDLNSIKLSVTGLKSDITALSDL
jgi:hypothetical protein